MANLYGIPYMGSKTGIAEDIIDILPRGERFVDLFGGGFAMTHCAMLSGKWSKFLYNEINKPLVELISKAINGDYNYERFKPEWISREKFAELKDVDAYVKYIWSFGNKGDAYLFGEDIEDFKKVIHNAVVFGDLEEACKILPDLRNIRGKTIKERRLSCSRIIKNEIGRCDIQQLQQLQRLELVAGSYLNYIYKDGDVVYCDPPYEDTAKYTKDGFNHKEFYDWVASRPYRVYFSSYEISDKRFYKVWDKEKRCTLSSADNSKLNNEVLYCNQEDKISLF